MTVTITDNGFFIDVTVDGEVTTIKKTQCYTYVDVINPDFIYLDFWRVYPSVLRSEFHIDFNDVTNPVSVSGADLKANVDLLLSSGSISTSEADDSLLLMGG